MSNRTKLVLSAAVFVTVNLIGFGFAFYFTEDNTTSRSGLASSESSSVPQEGSGATNTNPTVVDKTSNDSTNFGLGRGGTASSQSSDTTFDSYDSASRVGNSGDPATAPTLVGNPEVEYPHLPMAFMNYGGILPATAEVAAAVQHIQDEFVSATGAGTANPADPGFAQAWQLAQPTADEEFYALFGIEAFNQMSIMEARQRGHF